MEIINKSLNDEIKKKEEINNDGEFNRRTSHQIESTKYAPKSGYSSFRLKLFYKVG